MYCLYFFTETGVVSNYYQNFYMNNEYLSKEGLEKLKNELESLKTDKRKEIADRLKHAKSLGDLSENAEYKETLEAMNLMEDRIEKLEDIIKRAVVIEKGSGSSVQLGSAVKIKKEADGKICEYILVGQEEADISLGKISNQSPIGRALSGKGKGDKVKVLTPGGEINYTIENIS